MVTSLSLFVIITVVLWFLITDFHIDGLIFFQVAPGIVYRTLPFQSVLSMTVPKYKGAVLLTLVM